ncbi:hypothetical protein MKX01_021364 [Papaver californicum]|nr:hypothetical protein MKX01_021364 [Papaver californicum]
MQCTKEFVQRMKYTENIKTNSLGISYDEEYLQNLIKGINFDNPKILINVVEKFKNVAPDRNRGFRACEEMLGLEMEREMTVNSKMYIPRIGGMKEYRDILTILQYKRPFETHSYWMVLFDMRYIFASAYKCIFLSCSNLVNTTWLPLRIPPPGDFKVLTILNLDNKNFVKAILKPDAPLPPVQSVWSSIYTEDTLLWTPHMEMLHRGWENIEQKQPRKGLQVIVNIDLDVP